MTREEFEKLRDLPGKRIGGDLVFAPKKKPTEQAAYDLRCDMDVENSAGVRLELRATWRPEHPSVSFCFCVGGLPICRLDVNHTIHRDQGRTHKHELERESDPRNNLPMAKAHPELAAMLVTDGMQAVWAWLCTVAAITHDGQIVFPPGDP